MLENMERMDPSDLAGRSKNDAVALETVWQLLKSLNTDLLDNIATPLLSMYPREMKTYIHIKICTQMLKMPLFIMATKSANNPNVHHE